MPYGDYDGPDKPDKGQEGGSCNRRRCQAPGAIFYNHGTRAWYCADCRRDIEFLPANKFEWNRDFLPRLGHPQFETRDMLDRRRRHRPGP